MCQFQNAAFQIDFVKCLVQTLRLFVLKLSILKQEPLTNLNFPSLTANKILIL